MLTQIYLFSLVLGGVLLLSSVILGGKDVDADGDLDGGLDKDFGGGLDKDIDFDADVDVDADIDADADLDLDKDIDLDRTTDLGGGVVDFLWMLKSFRFWTFFLTFFGATGTVLDGFGLVPHFLGTLAAAIAMGTGSGYAIAKTIRHLSADMAGATPTGHDFVGKSVKVMVPVSGQEPGQVRVHIKGSTVDLIATTDSPDGFTKNEEALIIQMDGSRARIARIDPKS